MDPTIPTPSACSTVSNSEVSMQAPPPSSLHLLEISLISAQDLTPITKSMRTYAVAWTHPSRKLTTRTDQHGHTHPTWNEKFTFRVDDNFLASEDSAIHIEICTASWFREVLVGTVHVLVSDLLHPDPQASRRMRFVALQVRRPSGAPQGILNMGVSLLRQNPSGMDEFRDAIEQKVNTLYLEDRDNDNERKITLWRSLSLQGSEVNPGSVVNGESSMVNGGSELCSDIGPSASIVAADLAKKCQPPPQQQPMIRRPNGYEETGSSILGEMTMEEAKARGYRIRSSRWRKQASKRDYGDMDDDRSDLSSDCNGHSRRNSDGGLFSCFGTAYGIEFRIVCGTPNNNPNAKRLPSSSSNNNSLRKKDIKPSDANSA
ncbi:hypothetical protein CASFOL_003706 [Castilleja foliolosa]|uniref:C2 domain-containing protein n=1 Tax=Castilleja foliolosa TaxID=1961234 RepID=A0ABD3ELQ2_9LAMI